MHLHQKRRQHPAVVLALFHQIESFESCAFCDYGIEIFQIFLHRFLKACDDTRCVVCADNLPWRGVGKKSNYFCFIRWHFSISEGYKNVKSVGSSSSLSRLLQITFSLNASPTFRACACVNALANRLLVVILLAFLPSFFVIKYRIRCSHHIIK